MKFIASFFCAMSIICSSMFGKSKEVDKFPEFRMIHRFSERLEKEAGLRLCRYGINHGPFPEYHQDNKLSNFSAAYELFKEKTDSVSLTEARCLFISVAESFLNEINSDPEIINDLDLYPHPPQMLNLDVRFADRNHIDLGSGIATVSLRRGKIKYEDYKIEKYTGRWDTTIGKHHVVHEETYQKALEIVEKQGCLKSY